MNIMHYALGFPPYRTGGLTKYVMDLVITQKESGHNVFLMWPGKMKILGNKVSIKKRVISDINSLEVINSLPVPLDEGIKDVGKYTAKCPNPELFKRYFIENKIDVLHIHTLMGLYKEVVEEAKKIGIKVIFTSHDYFGICPKVTLFRNGSVCDGNLAKCYSCNECALDMKKIMIMQSPTYRGLKNTCIVKKLRKKHRNDFFEEKKYSEEENEESLNQYKQLRDYYISILNDTFIHFNSTVTESVYRRYIDSDTKSKVINITHRGIRENKKIKKYNGELKLLFLGAANPIKGFFKIIEVLDKLWGDGYKFKLNIYNNSSIERPYLINNESFVYEDLEKIMDDNDVLLAPSIWYETFGFTVEEALCFGVPVIVSDNVGAKDIVENKYGWIINSENVEDELENVIKDLLENNEKIKEINKKIYDNFDFSELKESYKKIEEIYR